MTIPPARKTRLLLLPLALAGALLASACATEAVPEALTPSSSASSADGESDAPFTHQDRLIGASDEVQTLLTELSAELDNAGPDITAVGIGAYGTSITVDVHIASASGAQNVAPESMKAILQSIAKRSYPEEEIQSFEINVWGDDGFAADTSEVGEQIGVKEAYLDREWQRIAFPSSAAGSLFA